MTALLYVWLTSGTGRLTSEKLADLSMNSQYNYSSLAAEAERVGGGASSGRRNSGERSKKRSSGNDGIPAREALRGHCEVEYKKPNQSLNESASSIRKQTD